MSSISFIGDDESITHIYTNEYFYLLQFCLKISLYHHRYLENLKEVGDDYSKV